MANVILSSRLMKLGAAAAVLFVGLQLVRPELTHPPVAADLRAPVPVKQILQTACYNCHSNETKLPWFDQLVPAYWLVVKDVRAGRRALNFSDFNQLPAGKQKALLYESLNQVLLGAMPPKPYEAVHPESVLSAAQLGVLENYLNPPGPAKVATSEQMAAVAAPFSVLGAAPGAAPSTSVRPAPNGLAFFPDYADWKVVSTTDRFDNHTLRVITGNAIAVRAIESGQTNPWPDGAAFAKIAWDQLVQPDGSVQSGEFKQVEFMVKDKTKYEATEGWGFGRWLGASHTPYGKGPNFAQECTGCHAPMKPDDFVFTVPLARKLPGELPYPVLDWRIVTSAVDSRVGTMSTLYGNDAAVRDARTKFEVGRTYPGSCVLALVVWSERADPHWYGAKIPGRVESVEIVETLDVMDAGRVNRYQRFAGAALRQSPRSSTDAARAAWILEQRPSVLP